MTESKKKHQKQMCDAVLCSLCVEHHKKITRRVNASQVCFHVCIERSLQTIIIYLWCAAFCLLMKPSSSSWSLLLLFLQLFELWLANATWYCYALPMQCYVIIPSMSISQAFECSFVCCWCFFLFFPSSCWIRSIRVHTPLFVSFCLHIISLSSRLDNKRHIRTSMPLMKLTSDAHTTKKCQQTITIRRFNLI